MRVIIKQNRSCTILNLLNFLVNVYGIIKLDLKLTIVDRKYAFIIERPEYLFFIDIAMFTSVTTAIFSLLNLYNDYDNGIDFSVV